MKICPICNKEFIPKCNSQKYCDGPHFFVCPVCEKEYQVFSNYQLRSGPAACSEKCKTVLREKTNLDRYGRTDAISFVQKDKDVAKLSRIHQKENWFKTVKKEFPFNPIKKDPGPCFRIDESKMEIYILTEIASKTFLSHYGNQITPHFGRISRSVGLVEDGILFQVLRFERKKGEIVLADFGTRSCYFNPNYYSKLMSAVEDILCVEKFTCTIPRSIATPEVISSLELELIERGNYQVYLDIGGKIKRLTMKDKIDEMKRYKYFTSDYLDFYIHH